MVEKNNNNISLKPIAGNGLLDRRLFLTNSLKLSAVGLLASNAACAEESNTTEAKHRSDAMRKPGEPFSTYGSPSKYEDEVVRFPSANQGTPTNGVSWSPLHKLEGMITPNGLHFERHHNGIPDIDPAKHQLLIHGLVKTPKFFTIADLDRYPKVSKICFVECGGNSNSGWNKAPARAEVGYFHGMASCSEWTGVPLAALIEELGIKDNAQWVIADGADAFVHNMSIPLEKVMDDAILALYQNGERIRPEQGYPLRLLLPGWEGVLNVKWLRTLKLTNRPSMTRNETARYTEILPSGKARQFTFTMEAKSLITSPSANMFLKEPGVYPITGIAWSGAGKIKKVEVSVDGGETWGEAELQTPVLDKCFTRFRIPWQWNGKPTMIKSRATDETGYVQPEREELIANRGRHGFFHYNAIVVWQVNENGEVLHAYNPSKESKDENTPISIDTDW